MKSPLLLKYHSDTIPKMNEENLITTPEGRKAFIDKKSDDALKTIMCSEIKHSEDDSKPKNSEATAKALLSIGKGGSCGYDGSDAQKKSLYDAYTNIFFGTSDAQLSLEISKASMEKVMDAAKIKPWPGAIDFTFCYRDLSKQSCYETTVTLGNKNPWCTFGFKDIKFDPCHIFVPQKIVDGSRFASCIMATDVEGKPHLAIMYLGSLKQFYAPYSSTKMYPHISYSFAAEVGKKSTFEFGEPGNIRFLQLDLTVDKISN